MANEAGSARGTPRWLGLLSVVLFALCPCLTAVAAAAGGHASPAVLSAASLTSSYSYDSPSATTARPGNPRSVEVVAQRAVAGTPRLSKSSVSDFRAAKPATRGADEAFHYTRREVVDLIVKNGLRPGSYLTKSGDLSPLQAQIDLALPPNRGLAAAVIRVDLAGLRKAGYDVGEFTRVGRKYNMPGGGTELQFEKAIPPQFLKVVRR